MPVWDARNFLVQVSLLRETVPSFDAFPFTIPAIAALDEIRFEQPVTFFVGENGAGKSTLLEAIAVACGLNPEGGSRNFRFSTRASHSGLSKHLRLARSARRVRDSFFLRAESYFNVATEIEALDREPSLGPPIIGSYGGKSLHEQSHGESFFALFANRLRGNACICWTNRKQHSHPAASCLSSPACTSWWKMAASSSLPRTRQS